MTFPWEWPTWSQTLLIIGFVLAAGWGLLVLIEAFDRFLDRRRDIKAWDGELECEDLLNRHLAGESVLFDQDREADHA